MFRRRNKKVLAGPIDAMQSGDSELKRVASGLAFEQKWLGKQQQRGVLSKKDILAAGGEKGLQSVLRFLAQHHQ